MQTETIDKLVAELAFFKGLSEPDLKLIAGCGSNVRLDAGEYLGREGEPADLFYVIRHGKATLATFVPHRGSVTVQTLGEGELVGWSWLFPPYRWQMDVRAIELVRAIVFDGACLRKKCDENPALGYELMKRLAHIISQRLEAARFQLLDVYGPRDSRK